MRYFLLFYIFISIDFCYADEWFKGNLHTHTSLTVKNSSSPEDVVNWYYENDYNFLVLSNHNIFIDLKNKIFNTKNKNNFILIPGQEVVGYRSIHLTAVNTKKLVPWEYLNLNKSNIIQHHINEIKNAGGVAILNHPNYQSAVSAEDILSVNDLYMFELFNGHPAVNNFGSDIYQSTEVMWDQLLTNNKKIYGVSTDDARDYKEFEASKSNPGYGWIMVKAPILNIEEIIKSMMQGNFYASTGVYLKTCDKKSGYYSIEIDDKKTKEALFSHKRKGNYKQNGKSGFKIEYIGSNGVTLKEVEGLKSSYNIKDIDSYVRAKITYTRKLDDHSYEEYYSWTQPVFSNKKLN